VVDPVCSNCGSDRLGVIQRGIDNWPVAQCFGCGPRTTLIPEDDGTEKMRLKRKKAIRSAGRKPIGSKKAIHTVLRPLVERSQYQPKAPPVDATPESLWGD